MCIKYWHGSSLCLKFKVRFWLDPSGPNKTHSIFSQATKAQLITGLNVALVEEVSFGFVCTYTCVCSSGVSQPQRGSLLLNLLLHISIFFVMCVSSIEQNASHTLKKATLFDSCNAEVMHLGWHLVSTYGLIMLVFATNYDLELDMKKITDARGLLKTPHQQS